MFITKKYYEHEMISLHDGTDYQKPQNSECIAQKGYYGRRKNVNGRKKGRYVSEKNDDDVFTLSVSPGFIIWGNQNLLKKMQPKSFPK